MSKIIERIPAYSNKSMIEYCTQMLNVLTMTKEIKVGRGRAVRVEKVLKHNPSEELLDKMRKSIEHYKKLNEIEMSRTIKLRDYQQNISRLGVDIINKNGS